MTPPDTLRFERVLARPRAAVWRALTDPELHARWWAAGDVRAVVGHRFTLDMGAWGAQPCEVIEVIEGERLVYRFAVGTLDTTLTWELADHPEGTRVVLVHAGFAVDTPMGRQALEGMGRGWPGVLDRLAALLAT